AMGQRMKATVELIDEPIFELNAPDVKVLDYKKPMDKLGKGDIPKSAKFVEFSIKNFTDKFPIKAGTKVTTTSEFSSQLGFGSSSTATVCVIKALSEITKVNLKNKAVFDLAYKTVLDIQGKGSGIDVAATVYGKTLYFVTGGKIIKPLKVSSIPLIVGYSGIKADTITLVNEVLEKAKKYPLVYESIYDNIGKLVEQAKRALLSKDWSTLGQLMNFNEGYLSDLGVEGKKLADMIYASREAGAYGAKLSGGGIGDCMMALAPKDKKHVVSNAITQAGGQIIDIEANVEGVKVER
ncbi:hypothetical protein KKE03_01180, partial [Patescibacteria group bacterium]|nr:hypothetical protein [Patescibacteria group bacterium]